VIGAVSGGVDSTVAAVLMHKALGSRFHAILVDNGCLRHGEAKEVGGGLQGVEEIRGILKRKCTEKASQLFLGSERRANYHNYSACFHRSVLHVLFPLFLCVT